MEQLLHILTLPDNIPILILFFSVPLVTWIAFREAFRTDALIEQGKSPAEAVLGPEINMTEKLHVWPYLLRSEFLAAIICTILLFVWSIALNAPLESPANANLTPNPSKAPWYFLGLQELLVYFDPWIAGVVLPTVIVIGLMAIPYLDINPKGNGYYTWKDRRFAISVFCFGFLIMWVLLIIIGTFIRGPGWMWFNLGNTWDHNKVIAEVNIDLSDLVTGGRVPSTTPMGALFGAAVIGIWYAGWVVIPYLVMKANKSKVLDLMGFPRYAVTAALFGSMMFVVLKIILRQVFSIKYILVTDFFNV
jgi:hypothetical protein